MDTVDITYTQVFFWYLPLYLLTYYFDFNTDTHREKEKEKVEIYKIKWIDYRKKSSMFWVIVLLSKQLETVIKLDDLIFSIIPLFNIMTLIALKAPLFYYRAIFQESSQNGFRFQQNL